MTDTAEPNIAPSGRRPVQTARYAEKQDAIVVAATELLLERGLKGFTLADVAERTGMVKQGVAYYFSKRDDVAAACIEKTAVRLNAVTLPALEASTASERVSAFLRGFLALSGRIAAGEEPAMATFDELSVLNQATYPHVISTVALMFRHVRALFDTPDLAWMSRRTRIARGHLLLHFALTTPAMEWSSNPADYARTGERVVDIALNGLAAPGKTWLPPPLPPIAPVDAPAREAFLRAAIRLINEQGYRGASVEKISKELKMSKGAFYHHNDAKDDVVIRCFERTIALITQIQLAAQAAPFDGLTQLAGASKALAELQLSDQGPLLRTSALYALPAGATPAVQKQWNRLVRRFTGLLCDGIADGSVRAVDAAIAGNLVMATINAAANLPVWIDVSKDEITDLYVRPLFSGLLAP
jgi:AcrR family transcriptional regulator